MNITLRAGRPEDAQVCGEICYEAFRVISQAHGFTPDFPSAEVAIGLVQMLVSHPHFYGVVAEQGGRIVGSNFLDLRGSIAGVGPITVDPAVQNGGIGRMLMRAVMDHARERGASGVRLVQAAFHNRSLSLYTRLGFASREPLSALTGEPLGVTIPGHGVRAATAADVPECNAVCLKVHGHAREGELRDALREGTARVVEHAGRISGYATSIAFFGHVVGESNADLKALIGAAPTLGHPGFLLPTRNFEVFRWCLDHGLRVVQPMTLMSVGLYNEPAGAFLPSILY